MPLKELLNARYTMDLDYALYVSGFLIYFFNLFYLIFFSTWFCLLLQQSSLICAGMRTPLFVFRVDLRPERAYGLLGTSTETIGTIRDATEAVQTIRDVHRNQRDYH